MILPSKSTVSLPSLEKKKKKENRKVSSSEHHPSGKELKAQEGYCFIQGNQKKLQSQDQAWV